MDASTDGWMDARARVPLVARARDSRASVASPNLSPSPRARELREDALTHARTHAPRVASLASLPSPRRAAVPTPARGASARGERATTVGRSVDRSVDRSIGRSIDQSINRSIAEALGHWGTEALGHWGTGAPRRLVAIGRCAAAPHRHAPYSVRIMPCAPRVVMAHRRRGMYASYSVRHAW